MDESALDPHFTQCFDLAKLMFFYVPLNPYRRFLGNIQRREYLTGLCVHYFVLFSQLLLILLYILFIVEALAKDGDFLITVATSAWLVLAFAAYMGTWCIFAYGQEVADLITLLYELFPKTKEESALIEAENWTRDWANKMILQRNTFISAVLGMSILPIIRSIVKFSLNGQWENELPILIWIPFDPLVMPIYPFVYIAEIWLFLVNTCITVALEATVGAVAILICLQFKKVGLQFRSIKFGDYQADMKALIQAMQSHNRIIALAEKARDSFSIILFFTYLSSSMVICMYTFLIMTEKDMVVNFQYSVCLTCFLIYVAIFGYYGNMMIDYVSKGGC